LLRLCLSLSPLLCRLPKRYELNVLILKPSNSKLLYSSTIKISVEHSSAREAFALRYLMSFTALRVVSISAAFGGAVYRYLPRLCKWLYEDMKTDPMERYILPVITILKHLSTIHFCLFYVFILPRSALHATGRFMPISAKFRSDKRNNGASTKESQTMFSDAALDALTNKDLGFRTRVEMFLVRSFLDIPIIKRLGHNLNEAYINITSKITM
jgi:hypothetical protein